MNERMLFLEEVAREMRVSVGTVRYWVHTGKLTSVRPARRRMVRREDLDRFMRQGERGAENAA
jgi:excisionase family DNA binding protein